MLHAGTYMTYMGSTGVPHFQAPLSAEAVEKNIFLPLFAAFRKFRFLPEKQTKPRRKMK